MIDCMLCFGLGVCLPLLLMLCHTLKGSETLYKGNRFLKKGNECSEWKKGKNTYKSDKQPISHFKLLFQTLCGIHIFPVVFSDLCILLDPAGSWGLYFCLRDSQNGLFFKIGIFAVFYVALWWTGVPVQTGR